MAMAALMLDRKRIKSPEKGQVGLRVVFGRTAEFGAGEPRAVLPQGWIRRMEI